MKMTMTVTGNVQWTSEGLTLSTGIGSTHYADHRTFELDKMYLNGESNTKFESETMELALWKDGESLMRLPGEDTVMGWVPVSLLPVLLDRLGSPYTVDERVRLMVSVLQEWMDRD